MVSTIIKYYCDYCESEMSKHQYEQSTTVNVGVSLPNVSSGCGQTSGFQMKLCENCSEMIGIVNSKEYHDYNYSNNKLKDKLIEFKNNIIDTVFKIKGDD